MRKVKTVVLLSGGLDSMLAVKVLMEQGIKVRTVSFKSHFFDAKQARKAAKNLKVPLKVIDISKEHLKIVKGPKYGYGRGMNPCIDCHILMLRLAKEIMEKEKFDFVSTGEVLGERPMSQNKRTLELVEEESSLKGYLLRPLSAKLLAETIPEKKGQVAREKLFAIFGRSRKKQIELAKKWKIKYYPSPAGGCLLTDLEFSKRLRELFQKCSDSKSNDIELLKVGRHFWFLDKPKVKIVVGRNHRENLKIKKLARKKDVLIELKDIVGPTTLIRNYGKGKISKEILQEAKSLTKFYSKRARDKEDVKFKILRK